MRPDIKRTSELYFCDRLRTSITDVLVIPLNGGDQDFDAIDVEPPFIVISVNEAEKMFDQESTWLIKGIAQVISHSGETSIPDHAELSRTVYAQLGALAPSANLPPNFAFHGISIDRVRNSVDEESACRAEIIEFTAGVGG